MDSDVTAVVEDARHQQWTQPEEDRIVVREDAVDPGPQDLLLGDSADVEPGRPSRRCRPMGFVERPVHPVEGAQQISGELTLVLRHPQALNRREPLDGTPDAAECRPGPELLHRKFSPESVVHNRL
jgi:hypothetical protein